MKIGLAYFESVFKFLLVLHIETFAVTHLFSALIK